MRGIEQAGRYRRWLGRRLAPHLGIDPRALAAYRVALALLLLADLALRARSLRAFYTDAGVLPRAVLAATRPGSATMSLHALGGDALFQTGLFLLAATAATAMLVGYRTRTATAASWLLLLSLHARNPLVLNSGDTLLKYLVLWGVFLPLGARASLDARAGRAPATDRRVTGVATAGVLLQVVGVYAVNAAWKLRGDSWLDGTAVRYVYELDQFTVFLGDLLATQPTVLRALGSLWLAMLVASPLLVVLTGWGRAVYAAAFAGAHLAMLATLQLGLFPLVSIAGLLLVVPPRCWDHAATLVPARARAAIPVPRPDGGPASRPRRWLRRGLAVAALVLLVLVATWDLAAVGVVDEPGADVAALDVALDGPSWAMFAPEPLRVDGWLVAPARRGDGDRVDAFRGGALTWDRPPDLAAVYPSARWRKYVANLREEGRRVRASTARYLCRRWSRRHGEALATVKLVYVREPTRLDGEERTHRSELGRWRCR